MAVKPLRSYPPGSTEVSRPPLCSVGEKFLQYLLSLIGFARMDFSEQYLLEGEAQDVRNDENPIVRICQSGVGDISIMSC
jgi:hypothetical protein